MDNAIKQAETKLELLSSDEKEIALYQAREDALREKLSMISSAMMEGEIKGIIKGKVEGKIEAQKEIARKLLDLGLELEKVAAATELELAIIRELAPIKH